MTGDDYERLGEDAERLVAWLENHAFMKLARSSEDGPQHCAALVLSADDETFLCSVYETRPEVCRALERGGPGCLGELATKGQRPTAALLQLRQLRVPPSGITKRVTPRP